jgi:hypothetical protein
LSPLSRLRVSVFPAPGVPESGKRVGGFRADVYLLISSSPKKIGPRCPIWLHGWGVSQIFPAMRSWTSGAVADNWCVIFGTGVLRPSESSPRRPLYDHFLASPGSGSGYFKRTLGDFREARLKRRFDALIANDVIELLEDPLAFLAYLRSMGRPGATIFLVTPDVRSLLARTLGGWWHYYNRCHLSYS